MIALDRYNVDLEAFLNMGGQIDEERPIHTDFAPIYDTDGQYILMGRWTLDKVWDRQPSKHYDIGGEIKWLAFLSKFVPVEHIDIRDPGINLGGLGIRQGSITALPYPDGSLDSLSCLHVAEHIGLGRFGDEVDPRGFEKACAELSRVLAPGGRLYFAVPTGRPKVVFNAHRVLSSEQVLTAFHGLKVLEFAGISTDGRYGTNIAPHALDSEAYGCGMWEFTK